MEELGFLILFNGLLVGGWMIVSQGTTASVCFMAIACAAGVILILNDRDRVTSVEFGSFAKITAEAREDAEGIKQLRADMQKEVEVARREIAEVKVLAEIAGTAVSQLTDAQQISMLILRSQLDELCAFQELERLADAIHPYAQLAKNAVEQQVTFSIINLDGLQAQVDWEAIGSKFKQATLSDYKKAYGTETFLSHLAAIQSLENNSNVPYPERLEYFIGLLDTETSLYAYFKLIQILRQSAKLGEWRNYDKTDKEKIKKWWVENKERVAQQHEALLEEQRQFQIEQQKIIEENKAHRDGVERIEDALKKKGFTPNSVSHLRRDRGPVDPTQHHINVAGLFGMSGTEEVLLELIEKANSIEELKTLYKAHVASQSERN